MSAMPARVTELSESPAVIVIPGPAPAPEESGSRAARRTLLKQARRTRQRWALLGGAILAVSFGLTVGILDVLR